MLRNAFIRTVIRNHHFDLKSPATQITKRGFIYKPGYQIAGFSLDNIPRNTPVQTKIREIEQLTQGFQCKFTKQPNRTAAPVLEINYQRPLSALQDIHDYPPPLESEVYLFDAETQSWISISED